MYKDLFKKAKENNLEQFQIQEITSENLSIVTFNDKLDKFETSKITTYQISAIYQEKEIRITTEYLDDSIIDKLIEQAELLDIKLIKPKKILENINERNTIKISEPTLIIEELLKLNKLKKEYKLLKDINSHYEEEITERKIITEENELIDSKYEKYLFFEVVVTENGKNSTSTKIKIKVDNSNFELETLAREAIQNAIDKLHYQEIEANNYKAIITGEVMGELLNCFIPMFSAENIQKDISLLTNKINKKVFSEKITIIEDPNNTKLLGKRLFDDTGTKTEYKEIVKNGVFNQILYDEKTAIKDNTKPTGNDYGQISVRNLYIEPGKKSLEELIKEQDKAILIDSMVGMHSGVNSVTGEISLQSEGYYIENGKLKYASKMFVVSTNIMELLNNVIEISNNLEFYIPTTASPDILVDNIKFVK